MVDRHIYHLHYTSIILNYCHSINPEGYSKDMLVISVNTEGETRS